MKAVGLRALQPCPMRWSRASSWPGQWTPVSSVWRHKRPLASICIPCASRPITPETWCRFCNGWSDNCRGGGHVIGALIQASGAPQAVEQIVQAEQAGIPAIWATSGGIGGADLLATWAAAAVRTSHVVLGTSIVRTWPRHPVTLAEETLAIEQLAPGRFRLGIGPTGEAQAVQTYGVDYRKPLTQVREYLTVLRSLLYDGEVDFVGEHVTARARLRASVRTPLMASAAGLRAFELCGEVSDGAISWVAPRRYLVDQALPALRRGAEAAGRPVPPLIAHVPIVVDAERQAARSRAREQLAPYARSAHFRGT